MLVLASRRARGAAEEDHGAAAEGDAPDAGQLPGVGGHVLVLGARDQGANIRLVVSPGSLTC